MDRDWQIETLGFSFADPWFLLLIPLVLLLWTWKLSRPGPALGFPSLKLVEGLPRTLAARLSGLPRHLAFLALLPLGLSLARPQELSRVPMQGLGVDILLCLDISSSMSSRDMDRLEGRDRLAVAKKVALHFLEGRESDRVGLVAFARFPDLVCPMTLDLEAMKRFLEPVEQVEENSEEDGTAIGAGLALCVRHLSESRARSKVVILLSDGRENVHSIPPAEASKLARDEGVRVYTIGIGQEAGRGFLRVPVDFTPLEAMAGATEGAFFRARDASTLARVFERIDALEKTELEDPLYLAEEIFFPFLALGGLILFLSFLLRLTWIVEVP